MTAEASAIDNATQPKVIIRCLVYNHEPYLRDCLEGFVMQKTNFPFKAVVHDDCSTDGSAAIIREYAEKYPDIIEPIYETENQYSKRDGSLCRIMDAATHGRSPYIAYCEGDDYWIDPLKLQKQVDYMDKHPECTMTCTNAEVIDAYGNCLSDEYKTKYGWFICENPRLLTLDAILTTCAHTCTLVIKSDIMFDYPDECRQTFNVDYILQIYAAIKGYAYCFKEKTAIYRYQSNGSFTQRTTLLPSLSRANIWIKVINVLAFLNKHTRYKYEENFNKAIYKYIFHASSHEPAVIESLCQKYGYILLITSPITIGNNYSFIKRLHKLLVKLKWFPFSIGNFIIILKNTSFLTRLKLTYLCTRSLIKHKLKKQS